MKTIFVLCALVSASGSMLLAPLALSDETIKFMAENWNTDKISEALQGTQTSEQQDSSIRKRAVVTNCIDVTWNSCQYNFNSRLGIDTSLTWRQADQIYKGVQAALSTNISGVVAVCNDNSQFYQCLGTSYYSCINLFNLIQKKDADFSEAYTYVDIYLQLQFMCNAGFEEVLKAYTCLSSAVTTNAVTACNAQFNQTVIQPGQLCSSVDTNNKCLNDAYKNVCNSAEAGWWGCELFRTAFSPSCYGQRCNVNF